MYLRVVKLCFLILRNNGKEDKLFAINKICRQLEIGRGSLATEPPFPFTYRGTERIGGDRAGVYVVSSRVREAHLAGKALLEPAYRSTLIAGRLAVVASRSNSCCFAVFIALY